MARKRIEEIVVDVVFEGAEELKKLSSGFRELAKAVEPSDRLIEQARKRVVEYAAGLGNTSQVTKGTIEALKTLQGAAQRGGEAWSRLSDNILSFQDASRKTDREIQIIRGQIVGLATDSNQSQQSIQGYITSLKRLRTEARIGGDAFGQLGQDLEELNKRLRQSEQQAQQTGRAYGSVFAQVRASTEAGVRKQLQATQEVIRLQREEIQQIDSLNAKQRALTANREKRAEAETKLNNALRARVQLDYDLRVRGGREAARAGAAAFNDPNRMNLPSIEGMDERFGTLPNTSAALNQQLSELSERLANTTRGTSTYLAVAVRMAAVQRDASAATKGLGQSLFRDLKFGLLERNQKNLKEVISALQAEMTELDTTTRTGSATYATYSNQVRQLQQELRRLGDSYRHVGDMAAQAAKAESSAATARVTALYMNNRGVQAQAQAMRDLGAAVRSGVAATPLMLPGAGQTTAPGTGQAISGGARRFTGQVETTFDDPNRRVARTIGERAGYYRPPTAVTGVAPAVGVSAEAFETQVKKQSEAAKKAAADLSSYRIQIQQAAAANNGSISGIQRYRDSLVTLRNVVPTTSAEFKKLTVQVQQLDAQMERSQQRRRRMGAMEATQAAGAVISGGIFGGPEGAIGGALGTAVGGVPGAFAGAAIGAQLGMIRKSLGAMAEFTAEIDKQRIALRNVVGTQQEYEKSLQFIDASSRRLAIPQDQLNKQFTQLSASVIGAGGNVDAAKMAFEGIAAGIRGTGGSLADMESAMLATSQVFSKGKVSAEELRQQIGERLPGAFTIFAESIGKTPQELDKMLARGEVTLNDFMKFAQALSDRYGKSAEEIAASSQAAGDRLATTFARIREAVGRELQPVGAQFQETFARFFAENEQAIVDFAKGLADSLTAIGDFVSSNLEAIKALGALAISLGTATLALKAFAAAKASITLAGLISALIATVGGQAPAPSHLPIERLS
jgi:tape measure domain-containing protein